MKRLKLYGAVCFVLSVGIVIGLQALSNDIRQQPGSFLRLYPPHPIIELANLKLDYDAYYIAGTTEDMVYLANRVSPLHVLGVNADLSDTVHIRLNLGNFNSHKHRHVEVRIDSLFFYVMDGQVPYLYRGAIADWRGQNILDDSTYFIDAVPLDSNQFAMRTVSRKTQRDVLAVKKIHNKIVLRHDLLSQQGDGAFSTDGMLDMNQSRGQAVYVYHYRNEYLLLDHSLNLIHLGNTIDTFSIARVQYDTVASSQTIRLSAPPPTSNKHFSVNGRWLFIHSMIAARNENLKLFHEHAIVDVYDLALHTYAFSFRIPNLNEDALLDMQVHDNKLYALHASGIQVYELIKGYFKPRSDVGAGHDTFPESQE